MRKKVIAGNWKMYNDIPASVNLISELKKSLAGQNLNADVIICPPFTSLDTAKTLIKDSVIKLGAQNMYFEENGAYTGEISAGMLKSAGCQYVILGHSERRTIFKESDELINKKIKKALASGLIPIFCVGETLEQRENGTTESVIKTQVTIGFSGLNTEEASKVIIAYEPVWAIGTGKTATPQQAQEVHVFIRNLVKTLYTGEIADNLIIQYGGSVKPDNAATLLSQPDIDGALVGGACLKADSFMSIITSA
ncbi:MAG: triose-phosphate isomerase [Ignavibacteriales bacterium]